MIALCSVTGTQVASCASAPPTAMRHLDSVGGSTSQTRLAMPAVRDAVFARAVEVVQQSAQRARFVSGIGAAVPAITWWVLMSTATLSGRDVHADVACPSVAGGRALARDVA